MPVIVDVVVFTDRLWCIACHDGLLTLLGGLSVLLPSLLLVVSTWVSWCPVQIMSNQSAAQFVILSIEREREREREREFICQVKQ